MNELFDEDELTAIADALKGYYHLVDRFAYWATDHEANEGLRNLSKLIGKVNDEIGKQKQRRK